MIIDIGDLYQIMQQQKEDMRTKAGFYNTKFDSSDKSFQDSDKSLSDSLSKVGISHKFLLQFKCEFNPKSESVECSKGSSSAF